MISKHTPRLKRHSYKSITVVYLLLYIVLLAGSTDHQKTNTCSQFIKVLCEKLEELSPEVDLLKIMTHLTNEVVQDSSFDFSTPCDAYNRNWRSGIPQINSTLTRDVYFYPKDEE